MDSRRLLRKRASSAVRSAGNADDALLFVYNEWTIRQQAKVAVLRAAFGVSSSQPISVDRQLWSFQHVADNKDKPDGPGRVNLHRVTPPTAAGIKTSTTAPKRVVGRKDRKAGIVEWWLKTKPKNKE